MEYLILGVVAGTIAGLIPGVGIFATLLLLYPFILDLSFIDAFVFYLALVSTTQYVGSVTATVFGMPGEASSLPAVYEGNALFKQGKGSLAISGAAIGSVLGGLLTLALVVSLSSYFDYLSYIFSTYVQAFVLWGVLLLMVFLSNSGIIAALFVTLLGFALASVGCDHDAAAANVGYCFVPFDNADLTTGLPFLPVICAIYVFPQLLKKYDINRDNTLQSVVKLKEHLQYFLENITSALRGTVIGFFLGFTPGGSTVIAANTAHKVEVALQKRKGTYKQGNYNALVCAETSNNAAAFTTLLPLFLLGLPLTGSEALFYNLMTMNGFRFEDIDQTFFMTHIASNLVIINILAFCVAWPLAKYIKYLYLIPQKVISVAVFITLCYVCWTVGGVLFQSEYYLIVFLALIPIGYLLRKIDTTPLVFAFLLKERFLFNSFTIYDLFMVNF